MDYQFHAYYLPGFVALALIYGIMGMGLLKTTIVPLYRKWNKLDKLTVMGSILVAGMLMLLFGSRQEGQPVMEGLVTEQINSSLMWLFHMDVQIHALFTFLIGPFLLMLLLAMLMDAMAEKKQWMELPFCTYLWMYLVGYVFYHPTRVRFTSWLVAILLAAFVLGIYKLKQKGASKKKKVLIYADLLMAIVLILLEPKLDWSLLLRMVVIYAESIFAAFAINRASVLRKPLWLLVTVVVYAILFALHFWTLI